jgi:fructose-1,6-bisphosphatase II
MEEHLSRNLGLDLVRVTEAAALAAGRWMGFGDPENANRSAAEAMANSLNTLDINGCIVMGEEFKVGEHFPLCTGTKIGNGYGEPMDIVLDAVEGARLLARAHSDSISAIGATPHGAMVSLYPAEYMEKIVVDRYAAEALVPECLDAPAAWTLALVARVKQKPVRDLVVFVLDRARHVHLIEEIRAAGARVLLRSDGDVAGALATATHANADILMGTGGVPEGLIAACAVKALGGAMLSRLAPQSEDERTRVSRAGLDVKRIFTCDELIHGNEIFFAATGITDGALLHGVRYQGNEGHTESLVLRCETGSRRIIQSVHQISDQQ